MTLCDLLSFVQFKIHQKHPWRSKTPSWMFFIISRKASQIFFFNVIIISPLDTPWNIASRGLNASKGLKLHGYFGVLKYITVDVLTAFFLYPKFVNNKIEIEFASPIKVKIYVSQPLEISTTQGKESKYKSNLRKVTF